MVVHLTLWLLASGPDRRRQYTLLRINTLVFESTIFRYIPARQLYNIRLMRLLDSRESM